MDLFIPVSLINNTAKKFDISNLYDKAASRKRCNNIDSQQNKICLHAAWNHFGVFIYTQRNLP